MHRDSIEEVLVVCCLLLADAEGAVVQDVQPAGG